MFKITEQKFFDYIYCPLKYYLKHIKNINIEDHITINKILKNIPEFFYTYLLSNQKVPSMNQLTKKYESLFLPYKTLFSNKQYNEGLLLLRNFYNWACDNKIAVVDSNSKYVISNNNIILEGINDPIAINKNKDLEILIVDFSNRTPNQLYIDNKLKYTIDVYAFNNSHRDYKVQAVKIHHVKSNNDYITSRNDIDFNRLFSTMDNVCKCIENNLYYPRETNMCLTCNYRYYCKAWH